MRGFERSGDSGKETGEKSGAGRGKPIKDFVRLGQFKESYSPQVIREMNYARMVQGENQTAAQMEGNNGRGYFSGENGVLKGISPQQIRERDFSGPFIEAITHNRSRVPDEQETKAKSIVERWREKAEEEEKRLIRGKGSLKGIGEKSAGVEKALWTIKEDPE